MQENDARREQLVAAAEALVSWIHTRRRAWPDLPPGYTPRADTRRMAPSLVAADLTPIAEAIGPLRPIDPAPPEEAVVESAGEPEPLAPPRSRRIARQVLELLARAFVAAIHLIGSALRWVFSLLLGIARWTGAAVSRPRRRRTTQRARRSRRPLVYATAAGTLLVTGYLGRPYWATVAERISPPATEPQPVVETPPATTTAGQLMVRSDPPGARVSVDGKPLGVTPLDVDDLSLGRHTVLIEGEQGSVRRTISLTPDRPTLVSESIYAGFLKVFAPFELQITSGDRSMRLDDQNQVMLPPGSYQLQIENAALGYRETHRVDVNPGQTSTLSIVPPPSSLTVTANVPAVVSVDGEQVGVTPLTDHPIALGTRDILVRTESGQEKRFTPRVTVDPLQLAVEF